MNYKYIGFSEVGEYLERGHEVQVLVVDYPDLWATIAPGSTYGPKDKFRASKNPVESALDIQIAGSHYKDMKIQPLEYIIANNIGFCEGNCIKYVSRWSVKGGIDDLRKARHYLDVLIEQTERSDSELKQ